MTFLLAFLVAHMVEITAVGTTAYAISQVTQAAVNTKVLVDAVKNKTEE